jgi:peptidoglycan-associated lipoprotein
MRVLKVFLLVLLSVGLVACSCRTRAVGTGGLPMAEDGSILKDVNFAFDRYDLSPLAREVLKANAEWLMDNGGVNVVIEGHCDERGTKEYNMALGQRRAQAAYDYLRGLGISADRMTTISYGKELPLDPRSNEEAWARNRRAHFRLQR